MIGSRTTRRPNIYDAMHTKPVDNLGQNHNNHFFSVYRYPSSVSRSPGGFDQFCTKQYWITIKADPPKNTIMHGAPQMSPQTNKTIPVFISCSMPSSCASSGAVSAFVMLVLLKQMSITLYKSAHVHQHADVAADVRGRSQLRPGSLARADAPQVDWNPVPVFQRPR